MSFIGNNPKLNSLRYTALSADPANPRDGDTFYSDGTSRSEGLWIYKDGNWMPLDQTGTLNFIETGDADSASAADFTTGNNATFDGGGTLDGTFSLSTTAADLIRGTQVFKYVQSTSSTNDYIASTAFDIPQGYRGRFLQLKFQYKYTGSPDTIKLVIKDDTNTDILFEENLVPFSNTENTAREMNVRVFVPADADQLKYGFQVVSGVDTTELIWDDVILNNELAPAGQAIIQEEIRYSEYEGQGSSASGIPYFIDEQENTINQLGTADNSSTNGFSFTASRKCKVTAAWTGRSGGSQMELGFSINTTQSNNNIADVNNDNRLAFLSAASSPGRNSIAIVHLMEPGDVIRPHGGTNTLNTDGAFVLVAEEIIDVNTVVSRANLEDTEQRLDTGNGAGSTNTLVRRFTNLSSAGDAVTVTQDATNGDSINIDEAGIYFISYSDESASPSTAQIAITKNSINLSSGILATQTIGNEDGEYIGNCSTTTILDKNDVIRAVSSSASTLASTANVIFSIVKIGLKDLVGLPIPATTYISEVQTNGTNGGASTSGSTVTRTLNTTSGDSVLSLASDQITLGAGDYEVEIEVPAVGQTDHQAFLENVTDSTNDLIGTSAVGDAPSIIKGRLSISESKVFRVRHYTGSTVATNGLGKASGASVSEVYTTGSVTKIR